MLEPIQLRALVHHLELCLVETQAAKDQRRPPPEIRTGHLGRLGPTDPHVNPTAFSDYEQIRRELYRWCCTWRDVACPTADPVQRDWAGQQYCAWLIDNAVMIAAHPDAELFAQDLERYAGMLLCYLPDRPVGKGETRQLAGAIIQKLQKEGIAVTGDNLRTWASRNHISSRVFAGRATYLWSEVTAYLASRADK